MTAQPLSSGECPPGRGPNRKGTSQNFQCDIHGGCWGGRIVGMSPWCVVLVCSWRRLLADRHLLPFPLTLSLHRRWYSSASHHRVSFLFLLGLSFPLPFFTSLSFPLVGCPNGAPGLSLFHCFVSDPHRGRQMSSPLAKCVQAVIPNRR